jgi:protein-disulfide isomerase
MQNRHMSESEERTSGKSSIFEKFVPALLLLTVALAFVVGVLWQKVSTLEKNGSAPQGTTAGAEATPQAVTIDQIKGLFQKDVIKFGDENRKLLIVEAADPSCPWCHVAGGEDKELYSQMGVSPTFDAPVPELRKLVDGGEASFIYVYYPGHGNGEMGMKALYCANEKGKFWEAHDLLMTNAGYNLMNNQVQNDKSQSGKVADFLKSAVEAAEMKKCLDSGKYDSVLNDDSQIAASLGVSGTPSFFLNTVNFPGAVDYSQMKSAVDAALK